MALDKAIKYGKEHRKPYGKGYGNYAKSVDRSCRNHGGCSWCEGNRTYKFRKKATAMIAGVHAHRHRYYNKLLRWNVCGC